MSFCFACSFGLRDQIPAQGADRRHDRLPDQSVQDVCGDFEATLAEFHGEDDHVHLLVAYPPKVQVSHLVNALNGASSRMLRNNYGVRKVICEPQLPRAELRRRAAHNHQA